MAGILSIVCTPIGNLEDISRRSLRVVAESDCILAENIENTLKLLRLLQVSFDDKKVLSCSQHEEPDRIKVVLERLQGGSKVVLMSDAGAPGVSDPGGRIVEAVVAAGYNIEVIPGPSALIAALMGAGVIATRFAFLGFLPRKGKERETIIADARKAGLALVIYESPLRVAHTLDDLFKICGPARVVVARELTKRFETFHRGVLGLPLQSALVDKGELVIVVEEGGLAHDRESVDASAILEKWRARIASGAVSVKEAARELSKEAHMSSREAYRRLLSDR